MLFRSVVLHDNICRVLVEGGIEEGRSEVIPRTRGRSEVEVKSTKCTVHTVGKLPYKCFYDNRSHSPTHNSLTAAIEEGLSLGIGFKSNQTFKKEPGFWKLMVMP